MPQSTREIKRRLRSIKNTRQVTRAMEMVSAAKMRKSVQAVVASRAYANQAWALVSELSLRVDQRHHPLLAKRDKVKNVGLLVVSSNRGLCGGFNYQLAQKVEKYYQSLGENVSVKLISFGFKARDILLRQGKVLAADFNKPDLLNDETIIKPIAKLLMEEYLTGNYDKVVLAYTDFISALSQKPKIKQLLPIERQLVRESDSQEVRKFDQSKMSHDSLTSSLSDLSYEYKFEPTPATVLNELLPRLFGLQIYQATLESTASEHSARMLAMRNASDAARDMLDDLTLTFNQARQANITSELAEIIGGRTAIEAV